MSSSDFRGAQKVRAVMLKLVSTMCREGRGSRRKCFSKGLYLRRHVTFSTQNVLFTLPEQSFKRIDLFNQIITLVV